MKNGNWERLGKVSGILYVVIMAIMVPYLIIICDTFKKSIRDFDPLSELSNSDTTRTEFQVTFISCGILLILYANLYFKVNRKAYHSFKCFKLSNVFLNMAAVGQICVGIFPRYMFPHHLLSTIFYLGGLGGAITVLSLDLENNLHVRKIGSKVALLGYIACSVSFLNIFYLRYTPYRGIAQIGSVIFIIGWFVVEEILNQYIQEEVLLSNAKNIVPTMNRASYIMVGIAMILISFGSMMFINPTQKPWSCTSSDQERCSPTTAISLITAGVIILSFVLIYYSKVINSNLHKIMDKSIRIKF